MKLSIGIDVSKNMLDIFMNERSFNLPNTVPGIHTLLKEFDKQKKQGNEIKLVTCEASGGYEKLLMKYLSNKGIPAHVAHANKVRAFAKAKGLLAKTDKIDARLISEYADVVNVTADEKLLSEPAEILGELLKRRGQLQAQKQREENRLDKEYLPTVIRSIKSHIRWLEKEIEHIDKQIEIQQCKQR